ncbi:MAG: primosomal protein, partial [Thermoplasmata archaeon M11B2D]
MRLIREDIEEVKLIVEAKENGKKDYLIECIMLQANLKNRNGRIYPKEVMRNEVNRYIKESIN